MSKDNEKYYVVYNGREPGIYNSWPECHQQVDRYSSNCHRSYKGYDEAVRSYDDFHGGFKGEAVSKSSEPKTVVKEERFERK
ncbi:RNase H1/viroplasmin domain-containing protein, partial [Staphylococcus aureus]|nr:RNase H1/viroplasmin domain-containing protein [Staphylococcus aureus]